MKKTSTIKKKEIKALVSKYLKTYKKQEKQSLYGTPKQMAAYFLGDFVNFSF